MRTLARSIHDTLASGSRRLPNTTNKVRLGKLVTRLLMPSSGSLVFEVPMRDGSRMLLDPRNITESGAYWCGTYEIENIRFMTSCCDGPDLTVLDVGANIGFFTVPLGRAVAKQGGGRVFAFEPVANNAQRLRQVVELNGLGQWVTVIDHGLSDQAGEMEFAVEIGTGAQTGNAFPKGDTPAGKRVRHETVRLARLDDEAERLGIDRVDVVKLDVEGAEMAVLKGGWNLISSSRPVLLGEFSTGVNRGYGGALAEVREAFEPLDYRICQVGPTGLIDKTDDPTFADQAALVPSEKFAEVQDRYVASCH